MKVAIGLMASAVVGFAAAANADVFNVETYTENAAGSYSEQWDFPGHEFGTTENSGGLFSITITSGAGVGWDYQLVVDYTDFDIGFFEAAGFAEVDLSDLTGALSVANASANYGNLSFTANSISWDASVADILANGEMVTISWNAIPAPGALAFLGLAGLVSARRRRE